MTNNPIRTFYTFTFLKTKKLVRVIKNSQIITVLVIVCDALLYHQDQPCVVHELEDHG